MPKKLWVRREAEKCGCILGVTMNIRAIFLCICVYVVCFSGVMAQKRIGRDAKGFEREQEAMFYLGGHIYEIACLFSTDNTMGCCIRLLWLPVLIKYHPFKRYISGFNIQIGPHMGVNIRNRLY